ncbi:MAG: ribonuclease P protein component [Proteobacteria bacterium]|nr:ribonuclease P protein component [Pseudomonadota bacterium]
MSASLGPNAFPRSNRLLKPAEYRITLNQADLRVSVGSMWIIARANQRNHARLGMIVGRRAQRRAVDRNLTKRSIRETFRQLIDLPAADIVVQVHSAPRKPVVLEVEKLFARLESKWLQNTGEV